MAHGTATVPSNSASRKFRRPRRWHAAVLFLLGVLCLAGVSLFTDAQPRRLTQCVQAALADAAGMSPDAAVDASVDAVARYRALDACTTRQP
ncbi:hypothetical protein [Chitinasiproducens palmae]|uniref:hypothetical protein n=1 Tax=Chitinasiproducens palmae TaxID=1770053 RepID=UPI00111419BF|nr:hypothetical protein [Chitinasiproducens palmae]